MNQSVSATAARSRAWIISPLCDLAFLTATPLLIVPLVTVLARRAFTPEQISLVVISFASVGHHLPGFMRAYGDAQLFRRFRWRFLLTPPLVFATSLVFAWHDLHGLSLLLLFWATWHGLMQTYGFLRIYDMKRGVADRRSAALDFALCLVLFAAGMVFSDARVFGIAEALWQSGIPPLDRAWLDAIRWVVGLATAVVLVGYGIDLLGARRRRGTIVWNKLLLAATTGWIYAVSGSISTNLLVGVAMFEIFHAVQYYAIVWIYNRRLAERVGRRFGPLGFLFRHRWTFLLLYLAAIAAFGGIRFFGAQVQSDEFQRLLLALLTTSTLLHFYYDGFIWKVRETETSANLDIDASLTRWQRFQVPAASHVAKWAVFYGVLGGLLWAELRAPASEESRTRQLAMVASWTPELPEVKLRLAAAALDEERLDEAVRLARAAVARRPRSHTAHAELGRALLAAGRSDEAARALATAVKLRPDDWRHLRALGLAQQRRGRWDEAERCLGEVFRRHPDVPERSWDLGVLCAARGEHAAAVEHFRRALKLDPSSDRLRAGLVASLLELRRFDEAERVAEVGCRREPKSAPALLAHGEVLIARGRYEQAARRLEEARRLDGNSPDILYQLGVARLHADDLAGAERCFQDVLALRPRHALAHFQLGNVRFLYEQYEQAERRFLECARLAPDFPDAHHNLGAVRYCLGRFDEAVDAYGEALRLKPDQADWHYNLAQLLWELGRHREARRHLDEARKRGADVDPEMERQWSLSRLPPSF